MERRARLALLAAVAVLLAAVGCLATTWSGGPSASTATVVRPSAEVRGVGPEAVALPSSRAASIRSVAHRVDPPRLPWLVGLATVGLVLAAGGDATRRPQPLRARVPRGPAGTARRGRAPPRR
ncbi:MAG: hypothetical protein R2746_18665, partial [Acidimicrobiales bacterium]